MNNDDDLDVRRRIVYTTLLRIHYKRRVRGFAYAALVLVVVMVAIGHANIGTYFMVAAAWYAIGVTSKW